LRRLWGVAEVEWERSEMDLRRRGCCFHWADLVWAYRNTDKVTGRALRDCVVWVVAGYLRGRWLGFEGEDRAWEREPWEGGMMRAVMKVSEFAVDLVEQLAGKRGKWCGRGVEGWM
jgi:hypothetical protein